jgi:thiamine biosynthesis lipoprotein
MTMPFRSCLNFWKRVPTPPTVRHIARYERVLGTSLELQILADTRELCLAAETAVLQEIDRLERILSAYRADSELRCWQETQDSAQSVSPELATVLAAAEQWRQATDSAFHPAAEALTRLWREGAEQGIEPAPETLAQIVGQLRTPLWEADPERRTACRKTSLPVTLNAIAKGFILDCACDTAMRQPGVQATLVNIGGDIRHGGGKSVPVVIADPFAPEDNAVPLATVRIQNMGIATSGNYRRGFQIGERWYSHLLDPRTGYPTDAVVSASVIAESALLADVLTTAFSVMTLEESLRLADSLPRVGVLLVSRSREICSNALWRKHSP